MTKDLVEVKDKQEVALLTIVNGSHNLRTAKKN